MSVGNIQTPFWVRCWTVGETCTLHWLVIDSHHSCSQRHLSVMLRRTIYGIFSQPQNSRGKPNSLENLFLCQQRSSAECHGSGCSRQEADSMHLHFSPACQCLWGRKGWNLFHLYQSIPFTSITLAWTSWFPLIFTLWYQYRNGSIWPVKSFLPHYKVSA